MGTATDERDDVADENRRLRRTMRDLVALSTLPAVWLGLAVEGIARGLADVLLHTLALELVYIRLTSPDRSTVEVVRTPRGAALDPAAVRTMLAPALLSDGTAAQAVIPRGPAAGDLYVAVTRFGVGEEQGVLVSGSLDPRFPTERDRLLLGVGANQTAIVLQRRRAEDALRRAGEQARTILESITDAFLALDADWRFTYVNRQAESVLARRKEELLGKVIWDIYPALAGSEFERAYRAAREGRAASVTAFSPDRQGWYEVHAYPAPTGIAVYFRDVTEQRTADERLRAAEAQFRAMADHIPQLSWMAAPDGSLFWFNRRWYEYTGTTFEQVQGHGWHRIVDPEELPRVLERFTRQLASGEAWEDTFALRRHDGQLRWHLGRALPIRDERGAVERWFGSHTDVTEQRKMAADLAAADRRKNEFLATLAHELRNPLAPIRAGLEVLRLSGDDRNAVERARAVMDRQLGQMVRLIDDLMDLSRITSGKIELRKQHVPLAAVVNSAIETARPLLDKMGQTLELDLPGEPMVVDADLTRLAQVFMNLLTNASKYSERGSRIALRVERRGHEVVVSVEDDGIGIAADHLPTIFDMFAQAERSLDRAQGGLGIGLTLVKRLVEMHGGTVEAHSAGPELGSQFVVRLPLVSEQPAPVAADRRDARPLRPALRILVVDDNQDGADTLATMLEYMGNQTRVAYDGMAAVAATAEFGPDVVLLDLGLPKLDGYEACRRIRAQPGGDAVFVVAQTGWGQLADRERTREAAFDHHLVKPIDPRALEKLLADLAPRRDRPR